VEDGLIFEQESKNMGLLDAIAEFLTGGTGPASDIDTTPAEEQGNNEPDPEDE